MGGSGDERAATVCKPDVRCSLAGALTSLLRLPRQGRSLKRVAYVNTLINERRSGMQTKKESIRSEIVRVARREFLNKGFKETSMRVIAQEAGTSLSNIYNYYRSKDQLFSEVLAPAILAMERIFEDQNREAGLNIDFLRSGGFIPRFKRLITDLILQHREELNILFFKAQGSELESFRERLIERHTRGELDYLARFKAQYHEVEAGISDFFVHNMSSWWFSTLGELVMHELSRRQLECFITEYIEYATAGWKRLMGIEP